MDLPELKNLSKAIGKADDSAGRFLLDSLGGQVGRNFDIDSIFVVKTGEGEFHWLVFEFLKCDTVPPQESHPRRYWKKNSRKFLSLWAVVKTLRKAGFKADLILVNYDEQRSGVLKMIVKNITHEQILTIGERYFSFPEWQEYFQDFNKNKLGDTWEILQHL